MPGQVDFPDYRYCSAGASGETGYSRTLHCECEKVSMMWEETATCRVRLDNYDNELAYIITITAYRYRMRLVDSGRRTCWLVGRSVVRGKSICSPYRYWKLIGCGVDLVLWDEAALFVGHTLY